MERPRPAGPRTRAGPDARRTRHLRPGEEQPPRPYLLGQALFSRGLLNKQGIQVSRSITLCGGDEPELSAIAREEFGLEVIIGPLVPGGKESPSQLKKNVAAARASLLSLTVMLDTVWGKARQ